MCAPDMSSPVLNPFSGGGVGGFEIAISIDVSRSRYARW